LDKPCPHLLLLEEVHSLLAHPRVLRKEPFVQKTAGRGRGKLMGFRVEEFGFSS